MGLIFLVAVGRSFCADCCGLVTSGRCVGRPLCRLVDLYVALLVGLWIGGFMLVTLCRSLWVDCCYLIGLSRSMWVSRSGLGALGRFLCVSHCGDWSFI